MTYLVIALTVLALIVWLGLNYRSLSGIRTKALESSAKLDAELVRRHETIAEFCDSLSIHLASYKQLSDALDEARSRAHGASRQSAKEVQKAENDLGDALGQLLQVLQKDEKLADNADYIKMRDAVLDAEDAVTLAGQNRNQHVARFNAQQTLFPASLFVKQLGIMPMEELSIEDVFAKYPLKIKATMPLKKRSIILGGSEQTDK